MDDNEYSMSDGDVLSEIKQLAYTSQEISAEVERMRSRHDDLEYIEESIYTLFDSIEVMTNRLSTFVQNLR